MNTSPAPIKYIDRKSGKLCTETVMGNGALNFAYNTLLGRSLWGLLFNTGLFSGIIGKFYDSKFSHSMIRDLLKIPGLNVEEAEFEWQSYDSFNDFFTRKLKSGCRIPAAEKNALCSPADGRLLVYPYITSDQKFPVKGAVRSLNDLCGTKLTDAGYSVAVVRLAPIDYHRYHFPCDCKINGNVKKIAGKYHSVNPIAFAKAPDLFVENTRCITPLYSETFGSFYFLDIGAFGVGSIVNTYYGTEFHKFEEKGFFKFGGSTVILVMECDKIKFDDDLVENSAAGIETLVRCGEQIAYAAV